MKNSLFDSLFSSESCAFYQQNSSSLKIYHFRLYIVENKGFGAAPKRCGIHSKPNFNVENLFLLVSKTLNSVHSKLRHTSYEENTAAA